MWVFVECNVGSGKLLWCFSSFPALTHTRLIYLIGIISLTYSAETPVANAHAACNYDVYTHLTQHDTLIDITSTKTRSSEVQLELMCAALN